VIIEIKVKTNSRRQFVKKITDSSYEVSTRAVPEKGMANDEVIHLMAAELHVPSSILTIKSGRTSKRKLLKLDI
jgi:uncharacterized protein